MTIYINKEGKKACLVRMKKRHAGWFVIYRPTDLTYDCIMPRDCFYRKFKQMKEEKK